jgi:hypothetical protein
VGSAGGGEGEGEGVGGGEQRQQEDAGLSSSLAFQRLLEERCELVERLAIPTWRPWHADDLTVWKCKGPPPTGAKPRRRGGKSKKGNSNKATAVAGGEAQVVPEGPLHSQPPAEEVEAVENKEPPPAHHHEQPSRPQPPLSSASNATATDFGFDGAAVVIGSCTAASRSAVALPNEACVRRTGRVQSSSRLSLASARFGG